MVRTQIQLSEAEHRRLKRWAGKLGISMAEAVRRCVSERLSREEQAPTWEQRVREALSVMGKYRDTGAGVAEEHDSYLADIYGR